MEQYFFGSVRLGEVSNLVATGPEATGAGHRGRNSVKIFASVEVYSGQFIYRPDEIFKAETYLDFLEQRLVRRYCRRGQRVIYIHDHAPYRREQRVLEWFGANASWLELHGLPAYSPQFNAAEPLWHHTRPLPDEIRLSAVAKEPQEGVYMHRCLLDDKSGNSVARQRCRT